MLKEGLEKLDFSAEQISFLEPKFEKYIEELQIFKSTCNSILGTDEHDEIVSRHILDSLAPYKIFCTMTEEILAKKGGDYKIDDIVGAKEVTANGGTVQTIDFVDGFSTTNYFKKLKDSTI